MPPGPEPITATFLPVGAATAGVVNGAFWGMAPVFGQRLALGDAGIALLMSATIFGGVALQWPIGHLSDRFDRRSVLIAISFATAAVAVAIAVVVIQALPGTGAAKYPPVTGAEYLRMRLDATYKDKVTP